MSETNTQARLEELAQKLGVPTRGRPLSDILKDIEDASLPGEALELLGDVSDGLMEALGPGARRTGPKR